MKNFVKLFGIIALIAVIGFSIASCNADDGGVSVDQALNGTWVGNGMVYIFNNGSFRAYGTKIGNTTGTYSTDNGVLTLKVQSQKETNEYSISGNTLIVGRLTYTREDKIDPALNGTWKDNIYTYTFNNGSFVNKYTNIEMKEVTNKGTYTANEGLLNLYYENPTSSWGWSKNAYSVDGTTLTIGTMTLTKQ